MGSPPRHSLICVGLIPRIIVLLHGHYPCVRIGVSFDTGWVRCGMVATPGRMSMIASIVCVYLWDRW